MLPLVTIMIPTYNQGKFVHRAIESALRQDYPNLEVIVSDDCSPDNTPEVVKRYQTDPRFSYFRNETNIGRIQNYRKLLQHHASGEWVIMCDGDDYYEDYTLISTLISLVKGSVSDDIVFVQGGKKTVYTDSNIFVFSYPRINSDVEIVRNKEYFFLYPKLGHFAHMSTLYRRNLALHVGFYTENISSSDVESFLRLSLHGKVILTKKTYGTWVIHGNNFSQNLNFIENKRNLAFIHKCYRYAITQSVDSKRLVRWKKYLVSKYLEKWLSQIAAQSEVSFSSRLQSISQVLGTVANEHREVLFCSTFYKMLITLPYKVVTGKQTIR